MVVLACISPQSSVTKAYYTNSLQRQSFFDPIERFVNLKQTQKFECLMEQIRHQRTLWRCAFGGHRCNYAHHNTLRLCYFQS